MMETKSEYKMTDLGEIPVDWDVKKFSEVTKLITCGVAARPEYVEKGVPFLSSKNVKENKIVFSGFNMISEEKHRELTKYNMPEKGDILYTRVGSFGEAAVIGELPEFSIFVSLTLIKPIQEYFNSYFLSYLLNSDMYKKLAKNGTTGLAVQNLNVSVVRNYPMIIPSLKEQQKIAEILSTVDEQIDQTDQLIEKTKELKKGLMQQLLTKGIGHTEFKQTELGEIPVEWEVTKQGDIANFLNGRAYKQTEFTKSGTPIIRIQNLTGGNNYVYSDMQLEENKYVDYGDLIYAWSATFGPYIWKGSKSIYHYHIWKIEVNENLLDKYFFFYRLDQLSVEMHSQKNGSAFAHITKGGMESHLVPLPPLKEQQEIADILSSVDEDIDGYEQEKAKYEELKKGLMQQLLTGKTRVKVD